MTAANYTPSIPKEFWSHWREFKSNLEKEVGPFPDQWDKLNLAGKELMELLASKGKYLRVEIRSAIKREPVCFFHLSTWSELKALALGLSGLDWEEVLLPVLSDLVRKKEKGGRVFFSIENL